MLIPWKECLSTITEPRVVLQMTTSPTGDAFITAGNNQLIHIYSIHTLQKIMTCEPSATNDIMDGHKSSGIDLDIMYSSYWIATLVKLSPFRFLLSVCTQTPSEWYLEFYIRWVGRYSTILGPSRGTIKQKNIWTSYLRTSHWYWSHWKYSFGEFKVCFGQKYFFYRLHHGVGKRVFSFGIIERQNY